MPLSQRAAVWQLGGTPGFTHAPEMGCLLPLIQVGKRPSLAGFAPWLGGTNFSAESFRELLLGGDNLESDSLPS